MPSFMLNIMHVESLGPQLMPRYNNNIDLNSLLVDSDILDASCFYSILYAAFRYPIGMSFVR